MYVIIRVLVLVLVLLRVAWYTLLERKFLSYSQWRVGPNKVSIVGIFQPIIDGLKLILKEYNFFFLSSAHKFFFFPIFLFVIIIFIWRLIYSNFSFFCFYNDILVFMLFLGVRIFFILTLRIFSNSKFALLGRIRAASQTISYEIRINFILLLPFIIFFRINFFSFKHKFPGLEWIIFLFWWVSCVIECNRAPFDFAEGESELIRGFNVEYSSVGFVFIFLSEYGIMLFFSLLTTILFFFNFIFFIFLFSMFIIIRSSYPRYRYDKIMYICWKVFLPFTIFFIFLLKIF